MILQLTEHNLEETIRRTLAVLQGGGITAYPTETYYALGAQYDRDDALAQLFKMKNRPREKAMPLIIGSIEQIHLVAAGLTDTARRLISRFWPGPLTLILRARDGISPFVTANGRVAVRMPGPSFALDLARASAFPITATSANNSSLPPASNAAMAYRYFNDALDLIIDGMTAPGGLASTIIDTTGPVAVVLRAGPIVLDSATLP